MSTFAQYVAVIMLNEAQKLKDEAYSGTFSGLSARLTKLLSGVDITDNDVAKSLNLLARFGAAKHFSDPLTGGYWQIDYDNFRYYFLQDAPDWNEPDKGGYETIRKEVREKFSILVTFAENGSQFADDIINHLVRTLETQWTYLRSDGDGAAIPAADRIVTLSHNQMSSLDLSTGELVALVEQENSVDGDAEHRNLLVGQLKAGRELIRAQTFRAYLLYQTLLTTLGVLIDRYGTTAIGVAATKLLELLIEQVFKK